MQRIDGPTRAAALPVPLAVGTGSASPGYFGRGDPLTGVAPTTLTVDWANAIQEELVAVITAAGLTLDKASHVQLLAALGTLYAPKGSYSPIQFDGSNNWRRIAPDGFIEMGGVVTSLRTNEGTTSLVFPFGGFPNRFLGFSHQIINPTGAVGGATTLQEYASSIAGITLMVESDTTNFTDASGGYRWRAWGN